ncbi:hypothetical protein [uncultured Agrobacterium sp.]|uniref:hypothetical protein n=1 Tax=uncultured Agrobacterium sp. TaxID=157277 RepID=UPI0025D68B2A|nr:hypothetical protein [uncultured Agrobacterium sp.]
MNAKRTENRGRETHYAFPENIDFTKLVDFYKRAIEEQARAEGALGDLKLADYLSPNVPEGHDTVLGYLAKHEPFVLSVIEQYAEATVRDGWWLTHRCKTIGITPPKVPACLFLVQQGIFEVNCYPLELLRERFS